MRHTANYRISTEPVSGWYYAGLESLIVGEVDTDALSLVLVSPDYGYSANNVSMEYLKACQVGEPLPVECRLETHGTRTRVFLSEVTWQGLEPNREVAAVVLVYEGGKLLYLRLADEPLVTTFEEFAVGFEGHIAEIESPNVF